MSTALFHKLNRVTCSGTNLAPAVCNQTHAVRAAEGCCAGGHPPTAA